MQIACTHTNEIQLIFYTARNIFQINEQNLSELYTSEVVLYRNAKYG